MTLRYTKVPFIGHILCYHIVAGAIPDNRGTPPKGCAGMLNLCVFIFISAAIFAIIRMMVRPTEHFTVYKRK